MTIPTKYDIKFASDVYQAITGEDIDKKVQKLKEKAEKERQEKLKAQQEKLKAQKERLKAQQKMNLAIREFLILGIKTDEEIAKLFEISIEEILKIKGELEN